MTRRRQFYDPIVETGEPEPLPEPIHALLIERPGIFFHADDIVAILSQAEGLLSALDYFKAVSVPNDEHYGYGEPDETAAVEPTVTSDETDRSAGESLTAEPASDDPLSSEALDVARDREADAAQEDAYPEVARVEVFPDLDGKWYARPVDATGTILGVTAGSFDRDWVESDAAAQWPGKELFELGDAMGDSIWDEQHHSFGWNGRRRPSPKRLWA